MTAPEIDEKGMILKPEMASDFTGMAIEPFPEAARLVLAETPNHEDVQIKPDGIVFMPAVWYRRQLTRAFGAGGWGLKPTSPARTIGNSVEYYGALYCLGRWVSQAAGGCDSSFMSHADQVESARSDCLTKCCKDLGMASELWEADWRKKWQETYAETYTVQSGKNAGKQQWRLKQKRDPRAANLMGPTGPSLQGSASSTPSLATSGDTASSATAADTGEAATQETYDSIAAEMKRLKFNKAVARNFLNRYQVDKVTALTAVQAAEALAILKAEES